MSTPGEKVKTLREAAGLSQKELASLAKWNRTQLSRFERNEASYSDAGLRRLAKELSVEAWWLLKDDSNVVPIRDGTNRVFFIDFTKIGDCIDIPVTKSDDADVIYTGVEVSQSAFAMRLVDNSMEPRFSAGDVVVIDPQVAPSPGNYVVVCHKDKGVLLREYREVELNERGSAVVEFHPVNKNYPFLRSDAAGVRLIGTMVERREYVKQL